MIFLHFKKFTALYDFFTLYPPPTISIKSLYYNNLKSRHDILQVENP